MLRTTFRESWWVLFFGCIGGAFAASFILCMVAKDIGLKLSENFFSYIFDFSGIFFVGVFISVFTNAKISKFSKVILQDFAILLFSNAFNIVLASVNMSKILVIPLVIASLSAQLFVVYTILHRDLDIL
jgi:hypothetical protein